MTTTPRLIALCSPAMGSGKSEAARYLKQNHLFYPLAFATPLKQMTVALLQSLQMHPREIEQRVYGSRKEELIPALGCSTRHVMQTIGTEWGRSCIKESIWVDITISAARRLMKQGHSVVIDDMRFPNEYAAVTMAFGDCYRIVRPEARVTIGHASEGQLDGIHMNEIRNDGALADLHAALDQLVLSRS